MNYRRAGNRANEIFADRIGRRSEESLFAITEHDHTGAGKDFTVKGQIFIQLLNRNANLGMPSLSNDIHDITYSRR
jgi:hypothetical protein